ncbi:hypothetical protein [Pseudomonas sp. CDFA 610]|uniref:hypothetical protein n=1 Tax=Pseudomonas sp. CDFA 610 TaxID=2829825 RepID=UPI001E3EF073|nr:hypothetical protein [Pseudomonas sp. CDFA 610]MCD5985552.1 hypothetical protein [Pseudomonas sp. CDFA 610]
MNLKSPVSGTAPDPEGWGRKVNKEACKTSIEVPNGKRTLTYLYGLEDSPEHISRPKNVACERLSSNTNCFEGADARPPEDMDGEALQDAPEGCGRP